MEKYIRAEHQCLAEDGKLNKLISDIKNRNQQPEPLRQSKIDEVYNLGIKNGSFGGKLLGAGGGGFILFYVDKNHIYKFKKKLQ